MRQKKNQLLYRISLPDILQNIRGVDPKYRNPLESESGQKPETIPRSVPRNKQKSNHRRELHTKTLHDHRE